MAGPRRRRPLRPRPGRHRRGAVRLLHGWRHRRELPPAHRRQQHRTRRRSRLARTRLPRRRPHHRRGLQLPSLIADIETQVLQLRSGVDLDNVDVLAGNRRTGGPEQPVLVLHGTDDTLVPYATSAEFARDWPGTVKLTTFPGAGHTAAWNADPLRYENQLADFLRQHA
ncbi:alpha/beta fold hydrolase [Kitasatospora gansuensis]